MSLRKQVSYNLWTVMDAANEYMPFLFTRDFRNCTVTLQVASSFSGTIKFYASNMDTQPDLNQTASATNFYSTVKVINLMSGASIEGDTGFVAVGASDGFYRFEVNDNSNSRVGIKMTARAAGSVTVLNASLADNS